MIEHWGDPVGKWCEVIQSLSCERLCQTINIWNYKDAKFRSDPARL
jgi:hypothetical protein